MLAHCDLLGLVDRFDLEVKDRRRKADLVEALVSARQVTMRGLLKVLPLSCLRRLAKTMGIEQRPRKKTELVDELIDFDDQTLQKATTVTSADEAPAKKTGTTRPRHRRLPPQVIDTEYPRPAARTEERAEWERVQQERSVEYQARLVIC